jgi:hypothetical protein
MRILIDECVDEDLRHLLPGHDVQTVRYAGFAGLKNGRLLEAAARAGFVVLLTVDRSVQYQQNLSRLRIALLVISAPSSAIEDIEPRIAAVLEALRTIKPGAIVVIG